jgi:hypothetical protein
LAAAALLLSACTFHNGDTRGTASELEDELVGTWGVIGTPYAVTFGARDLSDLYQQLPSGTEWHREMGALITIDNPTTGPETVQVDVAPDLQSAHLQWRAEQPDSGLTLEFRDLERTSSSPSP